MSVCLAHLLKCLICVCSGLHLQFCIEGQRKLWIWEGIKGIEARGEKEKIYLPSPDLGLPRKPGGCRKEGEESWQRKRETKGIRDVERNKEAWVNHTEQIVLRGMVGIWWMRLNDRYIYNNITGKKNLGESTFFLTIRPQCTVRLEIY